jgi:predicted branched-subunit amino acid permease
MALFVCWNVAVVAGAFAGRLVSDLDAFGLDAAFPAVLLALVVPSLSSPRTRLAAVVGAVLAVATTPFLPAGLPVLVALLGLAVTARRRTGTAPDPRADRERRRPEEDR